MTSPDQNEEGEQRPQSGQPLSGQTEIKRPESGRTDPAETAPPEGQSRDIPVADQGRDQGADLAYDAPPAEGARDED